MGLSRWAIACVAIGVVGCSAGDNRVDPGDLGLRDLLGISPDVASGWTPTQRAAGRQVLLAGLRAPGDAVFAVAWPAANRAVAAPSDDELAALVEALAARDAQRAAAGAEPLAIVRVERAGDQLAVAPRAASHAANAIDGRAERTASAAPPAQIALDASWDASARWAHLPGRGLDVLAALTDDAQHPGGAVVVVAAPRLTVIAAYLAGATPRLAVNPVLLAALEPDPGETTATAARIERAATTTPVRAPAFLAVPPPPPSAPDGVRGAPERTSVAGGNPYSFYGSFEECAQAQRQRCEACLAAHTCEPVTDTSDGEAECTQLGANSGRGYYLLCINLSLAISSVNDCTGNAAPACPRAAHAADSLATLEANADFLSEPACAGGLDHCLAKIYGAPDRPFPGLIDGGVNDGVNDGGPPPRSTSIDCGDGCSNDNVNCEASPTVDCTGPSCNNSLSCDSSCASSNTQSGCSGNACASDGNGNGGSCGSGGGDCGGGAGSGDGGGGGCGGGSGGGGGGGGGGGCGGGSGGGDGCGGGSGGGCGSSSGGGCGGSGGGGSCGGGGNKCSVGPGDPGAGVAVVMSVVWGLLPIPFAAATRRRARRRAARREERAS
ncbi:MAG TPA: hypothetical protein VFP84_33810 [Kofleriaceae bacterium]|nr:hypothetical protein [Kofleriaceae bacterium]